MNGKRIIDVSEHQGVINWEKVKADGIDGVIIRCGYGQNTAGQDDKQFVRNADACTRLNIPFGIYLYSYGKTEASAQGEAEHALRLAKNYKLSLPIFYDLEEQFTETVAAAKARKFTDIITRAGYTAGVYASLSWFKNYLKNYAGGWRWIAAWGTNNGEAQNKPDNADIWQYTSRGTVSGINGRVDMNLLYRDFIGTIAETAPTRPTTEPTAEPAKPATKTIDELAREVIAGNWGNGDDRKKKLTAAGYNYDAVQKRVNELLKSQNDEPVYYTVKAGDTLGKIARAHRTTVARLVELNGIKNKNLIITGQRIRIK